MKFKNYEVQLEGFQFYLLLDMEGSHGKMKDKN